MKAEKKVSIQGDFRGALYVHNKLSEKVNKMSTPKPLHSVTLRIIGK